MKRIFTLFLSLISTIAIMAQVATMTVRGTTYTLSEETSTKFGELPAGTVFDYTCESAETQAVKFQILDVTANEMLKTVVILYPTDGKVTSELAIKYALANGHNYEAQFVEYNTTNGLTYKAPTVTHNYKFEGTANVAVYSTVKMASYTPSTNTSFDDLEIPVQVTFTEAIKSLSVKAVLGQMSSVNVPAANITTNDNITWTVKITEDLINEGSLQLNFYAIDNEGNRITDPQNGVGTPETCYINLSWASVIGLPVPTLIQDGKTVKAPFSVLQFKYDGIGVNQNNANSTLKDITISRDGKVIPMEINESMFKILGEDAGSQMNFTLPEPLTINGEYTLTLPARAFMLGHDNNNYYNGNATYKFTVEGGEDAPTPTISVNITKTNWATIGKEDGETIGTLTLNGIDEFDHFEAEIRCAEDPDQYITFANVNTNGGELMCFAWEGGHHDLYKGYHYTITIKAFNVPYYGASPVATTTYEFVGTGIEPIIYSDITIKSTTLKENELGLGWDCVGDSFDVTFSEPVAKVKAWWAQGFLGSVDVVATQKDDAGLVWTITLPDGIEPEEEGMVAYANINITAWDAEGHQIKGENGDHSFVFGVVPVEAPAATIDVNITKTNWATIGSQNGETIGTVTLNGIDEFDHFEAEIRCAEDPDQYITFANVNTNGGELMCFAWEGGHHDLYKGYHYTITIKAFDVPYYGSSPVATTTYEFVGTGIEPIIYSDITIASTTLQENAQGLGWDCVGESFDVTFSAPVAKVKAWWAMGFGGSADCTVTKKDAEGLVWTVVLPNDIEAEEAGMIATADINITAWDAEGHQIKGANGDHAFAYTVIPVTATAIESINAANAKADAVNIAGQKVSNNYKGIVIINGKKMLVK